MLPKFCFEVCQQVGTRLLLEDFVFTFDSFLQERIDEPAYTGWWSISIVKLITSTLFWRNVDFVGIFSDDEFWILAA